MAGGPEVAAALEQWQHRAYAGLVLAAASLAAEAEGQMKIKAPWQDRTGQARQRLKGEALHSFDKISIILSHGVDYGVYLELAHDGKYAILWPTAQEIAPRFVEAARRVLGQV